MPIRCSSNTQLPFALYIPTSFPDRLGELWWLALEAVIAQNDRIGMVINGDSHFFDCRTVADKREVYDQIYGYLRSIKTEDELRHAVRDLAARHKVDIAAFCRDLCMDWREIIALATDPLVTIGAHTVNHNMLKKMPDEVRRAFRDGDEPLRTASGAGPAAAASGLSGRRSDLSRPARVPHRRRARFQDRRDHAAGRAVQGAP